MNSLPSIYRQGALALSPDNVAQGYVAMDALVADAERSVAYREHVWAAAYAVWTAMFLLGILGSLVESSSNLLMAETANTYLALVVVASVLIALTLRGWTVIQHGRIGRRFGRLSSVVIPPALQELIDSVASGVCEARTESGTVDPSLFRSEWAILLFSRNERCRLLVRCSRGSKQKREIFLLPRHSKKTTVPSDIVVSGVEAAQSAAADAGSESVMDGSVTASLSNTDNTVAVSGALVSSAPALPDALQDHKKPTSLEAIEYPNEMPLTATSTAMNTFTPEGREEACRMIAALLDEAKISKRDVKVHHIVERWDEKYGRRPEVNSVRSLMKGQRAGAPAKLGVNPDPRSK